MARLQRYLIQERRVHVQGHHTEMDRPYSRPILANITQLSLEDRASRGAITAIDSVNDTQTTFNVVRADDQRMQVDDGWARENLSPEVLEFYRDVFVRTQLSAHPEGILRHAPPPPPPLPPPPPPPYPPTMPTSSSSPLRTRDLPISAPPPLEPRIQRRRDIANEIVNTLRPIHRTGRPTIAQLSPSYACIAEPEPVHIETVTDENTTHTSIHVSLAQFWPQHPLRHVEFASEMDREDTSSDEEDNEQRITLPAPIIITAEPQPAPLVERATLTGPQMRIVSRFHALYRTVRRHLSRQCARERAAPYTSPPHKHDMENTSNDYEDATVPDVQYYETQ